MRRGCPPAPLIGSERPWREQEKKVLSGSPAAYEACSRNKIEKKRGKVEACGPVRHNSRRISTIARGSQSLVVASGSLWGVIVAVRLVAFAHSFVSIHCPWKLLNFWSHQLFLSKTKKPLFSSLLLHASPLLLLVSPAVVVPSNCIARPQNAGHSSSPDLCLAARRARSSPRCCVVGRLRMRSPPRNPPNSLARVSAQHHQPFTDCLYRTDATRPPATRWPSITAPRMPMYVLRSLITQHLDDPSVRLGRAWCRDKIAQSQRLATASVTIDSLLT